MSFEVEVIAAKSLPVPACPAILLLDAADLRSPDRAVLLATARAALPGRPIILGGDENRQTLLDAINEWHACQLLPRKASMDEIVDAVNRALDMLALEMAVERCAHELLDRCDRLSCTAAELRATQEELLHAERLATVGRTLGVVTQRVRHLSKRMNALGTALARDIAARHAASLDSAGIEELFLNFEDGQSCFDTLLADMLALVEERPFEPCFNNAELDQLVRRTVRLFQYDSLGQHRTIQVDCRSAAMVYVDRNRLRHALLNLLRNAAQATAPTDCLRVRTRRESTMALIEVEDTGEGMAPETAKRIFTPFFTTKGASGMGLGLRLSLATIEAHGGTLDFTSVLGQGSVFRISLPIVG